MKFRLLATIGVTLVVVASCSSRATTTKRASQDVSSSSVASAIERASGEPVPLDDPSIPPCGDLLGALGVRDNRLASKGCSNETRAQFRSRLARYEVAGSDAAAIEKILMKTVKLDKLRFVCCGWESSPTSGQVRGADGFVRLVSMGSGETVVNERSRWSEVPAFFVTVELVLDEI